MVSEVSEMIERAAKALFEISAEPENGDTWEAAGEGWQENFRLHARAVIAAMREPTEEMQNEFLRASVEAQYASGEGFAPSWAAAIDAALAKATTPD